MRHLLRGSPIPAGHLSNLDEILCRWWIPKSVLLSKYCPILIILLLLQTEIIRPQTYNWISHFTYSLLPHYLEKYNCIHFFTKTVE